MIALRRTAVIISRGRTRHPAAKKKETPSHRTHGALCTTAMPTPALSGLFLYQRNGGSSPIHIFSVVTLATMTLGLFAIRRSIHRRRPADLVSH